MALVLSGKAPGETKRYTWSVPITDGDGLSDYSIGTTSGITVDASERQENDIILFLSAGAAGTSGSIAIRAFTDAGEELLETIYIPIGPADGAVGHSETAQSIVEFALRPITGITGTATAEELADGLEWLNGMLAMWKTTGADVGATTPIALETPIYAPDEWILAIKNNLRVIIAEQYGRQVSPTTGFMAKNGLQAIKNDRLANLAPQKAEYY